MYEGITAKVLDYDYAPMSVIVENRRIFINVSQEGKSDVDFLREEELLNGLKLQSRGNFPVLANLNRKVHILMRNLVT